MGEAQLAILIDYENVGLGSIQALLDQLSDVGRAIIKRAYADWSTAKARERDRLLEHGIEAVHHFRSSRAKNSSDICLVIDAVELLYKSPVDTFVIVTSDSDYVPLVSKLRAAGKGVIGAGRSDVVSPTLVKSCDRYIFLNSHEDSERKTEITPAKKEANSVLMRAIKASMDDHGQVVGSKLHQNMLRIDPSFDFKTLGHRTFTLYLKSSNDVKISRPRGQTDFVVELTSSKDNPNTIE